MSDLVYNTEGNYGKYIVQELKTPVFSQGFNEFYATYAKRLLWMDSHNVARSLPDEYLLVHEGLRVPPPAQARRACT